MQPVVENISAECKVEKLLIGQKIQKLQNCARCNSSLIGSYGWFLRNFTMLLMWRLCNCAVRRHLTRSTHTNPSHILKSWFPSTILTSVRALSISADHGPVAMETVGRDVSLKKYITSKIYAGDREEMDDPFYLVDMGRLMDLYQKWVEVLPAVKPFYAIKSNPDPALLKFLGALGTGFDCASKNEIKAVLGLSIPPDWIIYAHPCKQISHIQYAANVGVRVMTFDSELELYKVKTHFPSAKLVLRLRADDPNAIIGLGSKFGCSVAESCNLLQTAKNLGIDVAGVSFHIGSLSKTPSAFEEALEMAAEVFEFNKKQLGYNFSLLDIGGGFPGTRDSGELFEKMAATITSSLNRHFSAYPGVRIIAEPGRYFAASTHTLVVNVHSKKMVRDDESREKQFAYYINDGLYGSFNGILIEGMKPVPRTLQEEDTSAPRYKSTIWGPTCDCTDKICETYLPEVNAGDWIYFEDMGAYTESAASNFNGIRRPEAYYYISETHREKLKWLNRQAQFDTEMTGVKWKCSE